MSIKEAQEIYLNRERCLTDYPIHQFDDMPYEEAPTRQCFILDMPTDKYVNLLVLERSECAFNEVKIGYVKKDKQ